MEKNNVLFNCPTIIFQGRGVASRTGHIIKQETDADKLLVVVDSSIKNTDYFSEIIDSLNQANIRYRIFDNIIPDVPESNVENNVNLVKGQNLKAILAIGGGSTIDTAKGIRLLANLGQTLKHFQGVGTVQRTLYPPLFSVPTTAGTGSEVSTAAAFKDETKNRKFAIIDWSMIPNYCLADPLLTISKPPFLTATTGIDTLSHLIESYVSRKANFISDVINLKGIQLVGKYLERAYCNGDDIEARESMQFASVMSAVAFNHTQVGLDHSIAMPLSSAIGVSHGVSIGLMLPYVMEFNRPAVPVKFREIARAFGFNVDVLSERESGEKAVDFVRGLCATLGLPSRLSDYGVTKEMLPNFLDDTMASMHTKTNPRLVTLDNLLEFFESTL